ncbi:MAG: hypothetical protein ACYDER_02085 [Ktedonobacteraceae bacterium]
MHNQYEDYRQAVHYFTQGLFRVGAGLVFAPISALPKESQQQFKEAGQDFTCGMSKLVHTFANTLDQMAK